MSSLFYQNSLKSNTAKKDSAIGASEATALNSIQKEQRKKELEKQESSVGKFIEKEDTVESSKKNGFWSSVLDGVQTALDVVGLVPGLGELADGANAVIYTARGDYLNAALSLTACIPFAGWAATGGKFVNKAVGVINKADDIYDTAKTVGKFIAGKVDDIFDTANKAKKYIAGKADDIADIVQDAEKISKGGVKAESRALQTYYPPNDGALGSTDKMFLMPGDKIDRFGKMSGKYFAPVGTPLEMRALPPNADLSQYRVFEVLKPFEVDGSTIAPYFNQIGLGKQFKSPVSAEILEKRGIIKILEGGN